MTSCSREGVRQQCSAAEEEGGEAARLQISRWVKRQKTPTYAPLIHTTSRLVLVQGKSGAGEGGAEGVQPISSG